MVLDDVVPLTLRTPISYQPDYSKFSAAFSCWVLRGQPKKLATLMKWGQ